MTHVNRREMMTSLLGTGSLLVPTTLLWSHERPQLKGARKAQSDSERRGDRDPHSDHNALEEAGLDGVQDEKCRKDRHRDEDDSFDSTTNTEPELNELEELNQQEADTAENVNGTCDAPEAKYVQTGRQRVSQTTQEFSIRNGNSDLTSLEIWLPLPQNRFNQRVDQSSVSPKVPIHQDVNGAASVARYLSTGNYTPAPNQTVSLTIQSQITSAEILVDHQSLSQLPYQDYLVDACYKVNTAPQSRLEVNHAEVQKAASQFQSTEKRSAYQIAKEIYFFVVQHMKYRFLDGPKSGLYALQNGHGECGEYSSLFVTLCRAVGIPARPVIGFWSNGKPNQWHVWAEFQLPNGEWVPIDANAGQNSRNPAGSFGYLDNGRIALVQSFDLTLQNVKNGNATSSFLQVGSWWWRASRIGSAPRSAYNAIGTPVQ